MCERSVKNISATFIKERLGNCGIDFKKNRIIIPKTELTSDKTHFLLSICEKDYSYHNQNFEAFTPHYGTRIIE